MDWSNYFEYKDGKLFSKVTRGKVKEGDEVGTLDANGYKVFSFKGKRYYVHRVIYEMHYGPIPVGMVVDHVWRNRADNRIENLRVVTKSDNAKNAKLYSNNSSGVTGVRWDSQSGKYYAYIKVDGKLKSLGLFESKQEAIKPVKMQRLNIASMRITVNNYLQVNSTAQVLSGSVPTPSILS